MSRNEWNKVSSAQQEIIKDYLGELPVKLGAMAKNIGIKVRVSSLPVNCSGLIHKVDGGYEIKINRHESRQRQRFTLAHEISHFLLHKSIIDNSDDGIQDDVLYRSGESKSIEYEANRLAADLVMPKALVQQKLDHYSSSVSDEFIEFLAREFGVSKAAMEIRMSTMSINVAD